jgi:hypothetical protein
LTSEYAGKVGQVGLVADYQHPSGTDGFRANSRAERQQFSNRFAPNSQTKVNVVTTTSTCRWPKTRFQGRDGARLTASPSGLAPVPARRVRKITRQSQLN